VFIAASNSSPFTCAPYSCWQHSLTNRGIIGLMILVYSVSSGFDKDVVCPMVYYCHVLSCYMFCTNIMFHVINANNKST